MRAYFSDQGCDLPSGGECVHYILDWDRRRYFVIIAPTAYIQPDMGEYELTDDDRTAFHVLEAYYHMLAPDITNIRVDEVGRLVSVSSAIERPILLQSVHYPLYARASHLMEYETVELGQLVEHDRINRGTDLVTIKEDPGTRFVFKYGLEALSVIHSWSEMAILKRVSDHPNIIALERIVIRDDEAGNTRIVGFITKLVPSKNLEEDTQRRFKFKFKWVTQLTKVVDYLNLQMGVLHNDINLRNTLIDHTSDDLMLFDFNISTLAEKAVADRYRRVDVDSVVLTVYEAITDDNSPRDEYYEFERDRDTRIIEDILDKKTWQAKGKLSCKLATIRKHLKEWRRDRLAILAKGTAPTHPVIIPECKDDDDIRPKVYEWEGAFWERPAQGDPFPNARNRVKTTDNGENGT